MSARPDRLAIGGDVPTIAEIRAMLEQTQGRDHVRLMVLAFTGLRGSELRALTWSDLDFERRVLTVHCRADWWGTLGRPKSRNGYREIPMIPRLITALREWRLACPQSELGLVFPGRGGKVVYHTSLQSSFDKMQVQAGVVTAAGRRKYHLHALRHFFASWEIAQQAPPKRLQQLMGHGSIKMTYDTYGHWLADIEDDHARFAAGEIAVFGARPGGNVS
jgi:integrase